MSYHVGRSGNWDIDTTEGALLFLESQEGGDLHSYGQHALSTLRKEIERIGAAKAEADHALGFAVEAVERLEAQKVEMLKVLEQSLDLFTSYIKRGLVGPLPDHGIAALKVIANMDDAIRKARDEE